MSPYCPLTNCDASGRITEIEMEGDSLCVLFPNGDVDCNKARPNGMGTPPPDAAPIAADVRSRYRFVAGENHSCLLDTSNGALTCEGDHPGEGSAFSWRAVRPKGLDRVSDVAAGSTTTCAVNASGELHCWGSNQRGERGDGARTDALVPTLVKGLPPVARVALYERAACARLVSGELRCWGDLSRRPGGIRAPRAIPGVQNAREIALGDNRACAALENGDVRCFCESGRERTLSFATAAGVGRVVELAVTHAVGCARLETGAVKCFEFEDPPAKEGEEYEEYPERCFKNGSKLTAVEIPSLAGAAELAVLGDAHLCAVSSGGRVRCFDTRAGAASPLYAELTDVAWLASTPDDPCFVRRDGTVRCHVREKGLVMPAATYEKYEPSPDDTPDGPLAEPAIIRLVEQRLRRVLRNRRLSEYRATGARPMLELDYGATGEEVAPDEPPGPVCDGSDGEYCAPGKGWGIFAEEHGGALYGDGHTYWIANSILEDIDQIAWAGRYVFVAVSRHDDQHLSSVCAKTPWILVFDLQKKIYYRFDGDDVECE
jgi:hypothetical protein